MNGMPCTLAETGTGGSPILILLLAIVVAFVGLLLWFGSRSKRGAILALIAAATLGIALSAPSTGAMAATGAADPCGTQQQTHSSIAPVRGAPPIGASHPTVCVPAPDLLAPMNEVRFGDYHSSGVAWPGQIEPAWSNSVLTGFDAAWLQAVSNLHGQVTVEGTVVDRRVYDLQISESVFLHETYTQDHTWKPASAGTILADGISFPSTDLESLDDTPQRQFEDANALPHELYGRWYSAGDATFGFDITVDYSNGCEPRTLTFHAGSIWTYPIP